MNANVTGVSTFLSRSAEWWDSAMLYSLGIAAVAAVAVLIFTTGSVISNKRAARASEAELRAFQLVTEGRVADAHTAGIAAGSAASAAQATADAARAEAARFQKEAAEANLKAEEIKSRLAWRELSAKQIQALVDALATTTTSVSVLAAADPEAVALGNQVLAAFNRAGIVVTRASRWMDPPFLNTDTVITGKGDSIPTLKRALEAAGLTVSLQPKDEPITVGILLKPRANDILVIKSDKP